MTEDKMREAFEAWMSNNGEWPQAVESGRDGYKLMQTASAWNVWQAATRAAVPAWQPIATAPEAGTVFLAWRRGVVAMARRMERDDCEMWHFGTESAAEEYWPGTRPQYWMPLPAAPEAP